MKKIEHYVCDICGTMYKDESTAVKCEAYHVLPKKVLMKEIEKSAWIPVTQQAPPFYKYPKRIKIQMMDGTVCVYTHLSVDSTRS